MGIVESLGAVRQLARQGTIPHTIANRVEQLSEPDWMAVATRPVTIPYAAADGKRPSSPNAVVPSDTSWEGDHFVIPDRVVSGARAQSPIRVPPPTPEAYKAMQEVLTTLNTEKNDGGITHAEVLEGLATQYPTMTAPQQAALSSLVDYFYGTPAHYGVVPGLRTVTLIDRPQSGEAPNARDVYVDEQHQLFTVPSDASDAAQQGVDLFTWLATSLPNSGVVFDLNQLLAQTFLRKESPLIAFSRLDFNAIKQLKPFLKSAPWSHNLEELIKALGTSPFYKYLADVTDSRFALHQ